MSAYAKFKEGLMLKLAQLRALAVNAAKATVPVQAKRELVPTIANPLQVLVPHRRPHFTGLEIAYLATRKSSAISSRAGRSKYDPPELKLACAAARLRAA